MRSMCGPITLVFRGSSSCLSLLEVSASLEHTQVIEWVNIRLSCEELQVDYNQVHAINSEILESSPTV